MSCFSWGKYSQQGISTIDERYFLLNSLYFKSGISVNLTTCLFEPSYCLAASLGRMLKTGAAASESWYLNINSTKPQATP